MKKLNFRISIIIILTIILIVLCRYYFKDDNVESFNNYSDDFKVDESFQKDMNKKQSIISKKGKVSSNLTEKKELHATYYMSKCYVEVKQKIKKGEKMIKYTNEKYMKAPYDLVVTQIEVPDKDEKCTNNHYIEVSAVETMYIELSVDETDINDIPIGKEAVVTIPALEDKELGGYVTKISSTAQSGKFTVKVEFEPDEDVMIGMTANVVILN